MNLYADDVKVKKTFYREETALEWIKEDLIKKCGVKNVTQTWKKGFRVIFECGDVMILEQIKQYMENDDKVHTILFIDLMENEEWYRLELP